MSKVKVLHKNDVKTRQRVKNIIFYCHKCQYNIALSNYRSIKDIIKDANVVRFYGNEPSVRRAIRLLNLDTQIKDDFEVVMCEKVRQRLLAEENMKKLQQPKFKVRKGPHTIVFK
jgi:transposase-like protein